ncbi:MAG: formylglycine-generating enzyme family protein [Planctomyces sp.]|nr:formylglycine-generating enzyme family protein [Planctomyces sp.]
MGSPKSELFSPKEGELERDEDEVEHQIELDGFWMAKREVTQWQYVKITGRQNPSYFCTEGGGAEKVEGLSTDEFPVENVSWEDAQHCIKQMKIPFGISRIALPSEAQWEWACRGGSGNSRAFHWGNELYGDKANCNGMYPYGGVPDFSSKRRFLGRTEKVGRYPTAIHPWGLDDMHGNVQEWCEDFYGPYEKIPEGRNPLQFVEQLENSRVIRGGAWNSYATQCRSARRHRNGQGIRIPSVGFRIVLHPED